MSGDRPAIAIRAASPDDAPDVARIYVESSNAAFTAYQPHRVLSDELVVRWAGDLGADHHRWWVAESHGVLVAVAGIGPSRDPVAPRLGELDTIAVVPTMWRRGVGTALMWLANEALDADGYESAVLWTWRDYQAAYEFYRSVQWEITDTTRDGGRQVCFRRDRRPRA